MDKSAIVTVGEGRGFVVEVYPAWARSARRLVVTAAHCLPSFPPCASISYLEERTYRGLLGPLGEKPTVWAECLFADRVGDIAALGEPDNQALSEEADQYNALVEKAAPLPMSDIDVGHPCRRTCFH